MESKSRIYILLFAIVSACIVALKMSPQAENYGYGNFNSNSVSGLKTLGRQNNHSVHIRDANHQLMDQSLVKNVSPEGQTGSLQVDDNEKVLSKCQICSGDVSKLENHDELVETIALDDTASNSVQILNTSRYFANIKTHVGGAADYFRGNVDICSRPVVSMTHQQAASAGNQNISAF